MVTWHTQVMSYITRVQPTNRNVRRPSTTGYDIRFGQGRWLVSNTGIGKGSVQHCLDFSFVFSAHLPTRRNLFSASGILCSGKYQPRSTGISSLSLLLKSEKIPALLYLGKGPEYRPFWDFLPVPSAYRPQAQISNHGRACTQALPLYELHPTLEGKQTTMETDVPIVVCVMGVCN